jgi:hypothetical protein
MPRCIFNLFFWLGPVLGAISCFAIGFEVSGDFQNNLYSTNQEIHVTGAFNIRVEGCSWRIRTRRDDESVDFFEVGSVGGNEIYLLASHTNATLMAAKHIREKTVDELDQAFGQITLGEVPHFKSAEQVGMIWLAYASSCYFKSRTNHQIEPVFWFGGQYFFNRGLTLPGDWTIDSVPPYLPIHVVYFNDGFLRGLDKASLPKVIPLEGVYSKGYTNAVFEASGYKTVGAYRIPDAFSLKIYRPKSQGTSASELNLYRTFSFRATNANLLVGSNEFTPTILGRTSVRDFRFARVDGVTEYAYEIVNRWPTTADVLNDRRIQPSFSVVGSLKSDEQNNGVIRIVIIGIIALGFIPFILLVNKNKKKINEH